MWPARASSVQTWLRLRKQEYSDFVPHLNTSANIHEIVSLACSCTLLCHHFQTQFSSLRIGILRKITALSCRCSHESVSAYYRDNLAYPEFDHLEVGMKVEFLQ